MTAKRAAALGFFDGIHLGHAALMRQLLDVCNDTVLTPSVITFDTLPQSQINKKTIRLINSPEDRAGLLRRLFGIDDVIFLHFNSDLAAMPWSEFAEHLTERYGVQHFVVGSNFKFGSGAAGSREKLAGLAARRGLGCDAVPMVTHDGITCSSTHIRELLSRGDVERANEFLGHPHVLTDTVHTGQQLGTKLGTPTLNMRFAPEVLVPAHGVYATKVYLSDDDNSDGLVGVTNIGVRPTVDDSGLVTAETHIPGFDRNLYGHTVRVEFHSYLRAEMKFNGIGELKAQIKQDCAAAAEWFT